MRRSVALAACLVFALQAATLLWIGWAMIADGEEWYESYPVFACGVVAACFVLAILLADSSRPWFEPPPVVPEPEPSIDDTPPRV